MQLPLVDFCGQKISRLICGGNPQSGYSHFSGEMDWDMISYYTMPNIQKLMATCWENGINTIQTRGDRLQMRAYLEHVLSGGKMKWIAQTASEFADIGANISEIARYKPMAIYHHGTHTDNSWHAGKFDAVRDILKKIRDTGLPAGIGTHIPEVVEYCEEKGWETDFYMCCFYNLARGYKSAPATQQKAHVEEKFPPEDPPRMAKTIRAVRKPCIGFKIMAASRNCKTVESTRAALKFGYENIKPTDLIDVGMFPKYKDQVSENAGLVREILGGK
ncbi:MAG TPA: hypothetical protein VGP72_21095 [Planctomycetota bacterium]|jgi:hypothetical protein